MAEGLFIRVSNAATTGESVLLTDIYDATDGAAHELERAGGVYVATESSVDLAYTGDVARSFESGCIRGMIDAGTLTASFGRGDSAGVTVAVVVDHGTAEVVAALGKVTAITLVSSGALNDPATLAVAGAAAGAVVDTADVAAQNGAAAMTLEAAAGDVAAGEVLTLTLTSAAAVQRATVQITFATADA